MTISKHAKKRLKQRVSRKKHCYEKMASQAYMHGYRYDEAKGPLKLWMRSVAEKGTIPSSMRVYRDKLYLFENGILITVLSLPSYLHGKADRFLKSGVKPMAERTVSTPASKAQAVNSMKAADDDRGSAKMKQVVILRNDLGLNRGQYSSQAVYAVNHLMQKVVFSKITREEMQLAMDNFRSSPTICLSVNDKDELLSLFDQTLDAGLQCHMQYASGPLTGYEAVPVGFAVSPADERTINAITGSLKLLA